MGTHKLIEAMPSFLWRMGLSPFETLTHRWQLRCEGQSYGCADNEPVASSTYGHSLRFGHNWGASQGDFGTFDPPVLVSETFLFNVSPSQLVAPRRATQAELR